MNTSVQASLLIPCEAESSRFKEGQAEGLAHVLSGSEPESEDSDRMKGVSAN